MAGQKHSCREFSACYPSPKDWHPRLAAPMATPLARCATAMMWLSHHRHSVGSDETDFAQRAQQTPSPHQEEHPLWAANPTNPSALIALKGSIQADGHPARAENPIHSV